MKMTKKILSILLVGAMLACVMPLAVSAGTQAKPTVISKKALGEVSYYFCNTEFKEGVTEGQWYTFTAEDSGIIQLECTCYETEFQATVWVNDVAYKYNTDGVLTRPINTFPVQPGDEIVICIEPVAPYVYGYVYANVGFVTGESDINQTVKLQSEGGIVHVAAGATVYYQDNTKEGDFAQKGLLVSGNTDGVTVISGTDNYTDADADGAVELVLGGSAGGAGSPAVKPSWSIQNASAEDKAFVLTITDSAHECNWDDDADADCNTCGAVRDVAGDEPVYTAEDILSYGGRAVTEANDGLAFKFNARVKGVAIAADYTADYTAATVAIEGTEYTLVGMGAVMNNTQAEAATLDDVDGVRVLNVAAEKVLYSETDGFYFTVRITDIPDDYKDTVIVARPYYVYEDGNGQQVVVYGEDCTDAYNGLPAVM